MAKLFGFPHVAMFDNVRLLSLLGIAGVLEFVGGVLLLLGTFTRPVAFILSGEMAILNPADNNVHVVSHKPGDFSGDIDLLTRRPILVNGVARGPTTCLKIPGDKLRDIRSRPDDERQIDLRGRDQRNASSSARNSAASRRFLRRTFIATGSSFRMSRPMTRLILRISNSSG